MNFHFAHISDDSIISVLNQNPDEFHCWRLLFPIHEKFFNMSVRSITFNSFILFFLSHLFYKREKKLALVVKGDSSVIYANVRLLWNAIIDNGWQTSALFLSENDFKLTKQMVTNLTLYPTESVNSGTFPSSVEVGTVNSFILSWAFSGAVQTDPLSRPWPYLFPSNGANHAGVVPSGFERSCSLAQQADGERVSDQHDHEGYEECHEGPVNQKVRIEDAALTIRV